MLAGLMRLDFRQTETEVTLLEGPEIQFSEAVIDNGRFGKRVIRFETGRLAKQAAGAAMVYIDDDTALLSATTAGKHPREGFDFFPLTVDVEERMYAAGRIPGSFFRREGRPSTEAILACRLMDRPLRPAFVKGLRNEVQIVVTVLAINPDELYDVVAINASSMSTQLSVLRPHRRRPRCPGRRRKRIPVGCFPQALAAGKLRVQHGGCRPHCR
jgi:polyribonucleotide nucleotidyltransferase